MRPELERALADQAVIIHGSTPGWSAWLAAQLGDRELVVVVAPDDEAARRIEADVRFFRAASFDPATTLDEIASLPGIDVSPYADLSPDRACIVERVAALYRLAVPELRPRLVITSAEALARKTVPPAELAARGRTIKKGESIDRDALAAQLVAAGWTRTPVVDEPGTFAVRGGVIDLFAPLAPHPVRIELFGDEIETLRWFEAESQRTLRAVDFVHLHPVRETIVTGERDVRARLREYADEVAHPTKATRRLIEQLEQGEVFVGIEGLTPAFHDRLATPASYVPADARWLVIDPAACRRVIGDLWQDAEARYTTRSAPLASYSSSVGSSTRRSDVSAASSPTKCRSGANASILASRVS